MKKIVTNTLLILSFMMIKQSLNAAAVSRASLDTSLKAIKKVCGTTPVPAFCVKPSYTEEEKTALIQAAILSCALLITQIDSYIEMASQPAQKDGLITKIRKAYSEKGFNASGKELGEIATFIGKGSSEAKTIEPLLVALPK